MKCVRGNSSNKIQSNNFDKSKNRYYLNYSTHKRIIVKNIYGGSAEDKLREAKEHIAELQKDLIV